MKIKNNLLLFKPLLFLKFNSSILNTVLMLLLFNLGTIQQTEAQIFCPPDVSVECGDPIDPTATGFATTANGVPMTFIDISDPDCPNTAVIERIWSSVIPTFPFIVTCTQTITIEDTTPPTITCAPPSTIECGVDTIIFFGTPIVMDDCDPSPPVITFEDVSVPICGNAEVITRTWTATDACGNEATCNEVITIQDTTAPVVNCAEFAMTFNACPDPIFPNTPSGDWIPIPASGIFPTTAGGTFVTNININGCVLENCSDFEDMEFMLVSSIEENRAPGCSVDIVNEYAIRDGCENEAANTIFARSTIEFDGPAPVITCPADATVDCEDPTDPSATGMATATTGCGTATITFEDVSVAGCGSTEVITRTWTATDACGNTDSGSISTCDQTITVVDNTLPVIATAPGSLDQTINITTQDACPDGVLDFTCFFQNSSIKPISVDVILDDTFLGNFPGPDTADVSDNCGLANIICQLGTPVTDGCQMVRIISWIGVDDCGNESLPFEQTLTINEVAAPEFTCPSNINVECEAPAPYTDLAAFIAAGGTASDFCGLDDASFGLDSEVSDELSCPETITRTYSVADDCGNVSTCVQFIVVDDVTPPVAVAPSDEMIQCATDVLSAPDLTAVDNCDGDITVSPMIVITPGACVNQFVEVRTWTFVDACGNESSVSQTITVNDNTAPIITCPVDVTIECDEDTSPANTGMATATDNCDSNPVLIFTDVSTQGATSCDQFTYTITRTWAATDACGNQDSGSVCTQIITVEDTNAPVISCPADVTIECDEDTSPTNTGMATATDNCDSDPVVTFTDVIALDTTNACAQFTFTILRTWTAVDACGNQDSSSICTQTITVEDTNAPAISCPADVTIECDEDTSPANTGMATAIDNCDTAPVVSFTDVSTQGTTGCDQFNYTITRTWTSTDACGNVSSCVQTITIEDTTAPAITCPADLTINCSESAEAANTGIATATDICDTNPIITFEDVQNPLTVGYSISRTWMATDACGNVNSCVQTITVELCDVEINDPCVCLNNSSTIDLDAGTGGNDGQFSELVAITGPNGGPVADPNLVFQVLSITGGVDAFAMTPIAPAQTAGVPIPVGTQLVYNPVTMHYELPFFHYEDVGYTISIQQIVGGLPGQILGPIGNNCNYPSPVFDPVLEDLYCPDAATVALGGIDLNGLAADLVTFTIDGMAATELNPSTLSLGMHTVLMTFDGAAGINNGTGTLANPNNPGCAQVVQKVITVNDTEPPVITCPANVTIQCDASTAVADNGMATATDNCNTPPVVTFNDVSTQGQACSAFSFIITRTWTATDATGNASTCTQIITVEDTNPPLITCPADVTVECDQPTDPGATGLAIATGDNCAADNELTIVFSDVSTQTATGCGNDSYMITRTWTASDPCGNTAQCIQIITVEDTTPPTIFCPANTTIECDESTDPTNTGTAVAIDNCTPEDAITMNFADASTQTATGCGQYQYVITRTWTATDPCGNASTCVQTIMVEDTTDPVIVCPADVSISCTESTDPADTGIATGTDNCSANVEVIITSSDISTQTNEGCGQFTYEIFRTWLATDACGNTSTCVQNIAVADTQAPVVTCPPSQILTCFETVTAPLTDAAAFIAAGGSISDDCTMALTDFTVIDQNDDNGGDNCPGNARTVVRTYFIADACGNTSICEQTFTYLESTQGPVITSILPSCFKYCASLANPMETDITYETDCSFGATVNITGPTQIGQENCPGSISRYTYTVTDDCGRTSAPVTRDFIIANDGPTIECPAFNLILECGDPNNQDYIDTHLEQVTANTSCDLGYTISHFPQNFNLISCGSSTVVTFVATDACGRTASCTTTVAIQDNTAPEITSVYEDGICNEAICGSNVNFWFNEWKDKVLEGLSATDACDSNVSFTVSGPSTPVQDCPSGTAETVLTWVANDNCGNTSGISYSFYVVPANEPAPASSIMGLIATEDMESVENVTVTLGSNGFSLTDVTEEDGIYEFTNLEEGQNYSVTPYLDQDYMNGVSSFDLVLIAKHILGIEDLDSPYKMIAADINKSGSITTFDLVELRKLILQINETFPNNTSWRFVEAAFIFPQPTNPFASAFPELVNINDLTENEEHDLVGVKIGDVNGSVVANTFASVDDRSFDGSLVFDVADRRVTAGEIFELTFEANDFSEIAAYQFALRFDKNQLDFVKLVEGDLVNMSAANFGTTHLEEGLILTSWHNVTTVDLKDATTVFRIAFTALTDGMISDMIGLSSKYMNAEGYRLRGTVDQVEKLEVALRFNDTEIIQSSKSDFRLYQNQPNPFARQTLISFNLSEAGNAKLKIYDATSRLVKVIESDFAKGYNEVSIDRSDLSGTGMYYYHLNWDGGSEVKTMFLINE